MGARPSSYKGGGGALNDVDGTIRGLVFTDEFNGEPFKPGKNAEGKEKFHSLFARVTIQVDGAEEEVPQNFFVGDADKWEVGDNGTSLVPHDDDDQLGKSAPFSKFMASLVKAEFDEDNLPEDEFEFEAIIGARCHFAQEVVIDRKTGKPRQRTAKKGKYKGKTFDDTTTIVTKFYGMDDSDEAPSAKPSKASGSKPAGKGKKVKEEDAEETAGTLVIAVLEDAPRKTIKKAKLRMAVINKLGPGHPQKDAVLKAALDDDFLKQLEGVEYSVKSGVLTLEGAEEEADEE